MHQRERTARLHESARLKQVWFPDDEAAHARIDDFFDNWQYPDEPIEEPKQVEELVQEQDVDVEIVRMMPPRKPAEQPEVVQRGPYALGAGHHSRGRY